MSQEVAFDLISIGLESDLQAFVEAKLKPLKIHRLSNSADIEAFLEGYQVQSGTSILVSDKIEGMGYMEIAQAFNSYFNGLILIFITKERLQLQLEALKKNGFAESFLLPLDNGVFNEALDDIKVRKSGGGVKKYKAVKLVDLEANATLPFEVRTYMPLNKKYVSLTGSGKLSEKKKEILETRHANSVYVDTNQIEKFYEYAAEQLVKLSNGDSTVISATEKADRLQKSVRELFRNVLNNDGGAADFESGKDLFDQTKKVVENYVKVKTGLDINKQLLSLVGEGTDTYSHAQIVSSMASLLSMGTGIGKPEDLAIAGLFHDLGVLNPEISIFALDKLDEAERKQYHQHPRVSLNLLKEKKITVTPEIADIIEKHHERPDGKGFPAGAPAHRIPKEALLLAYADAFEYLSRKEPGQGPKPPQEVHKFISDNLGIPPEILRQIEKLIFPPKA